MGQEEKCELIDKIDAAITECDSESELMRFSRAGEYLLGKIHKRLEEIKTMA